MVEMFKPLKQENDVSKASRAKSFVRAFERAAGVVVLSTTLMFNCATTKSADTSSRYAAESTTTSRSADSKEVINTLDKIKKINDAESELIKKSLYHMEEAEKAAKIEEQARQEKEQARQKKEQALKAAEEAAKKEEQARLKEEQALKKAGLEDETQICKGMFDALMEMKELCNKGSAKYCKDYKENLPIYETECKTNH